MGSAEPTSLAMASPVLKGDNKQGILLCVSEGSPLRDCGPIFSDFRGMKYDLYILVLQLVSKEV